MELKVAKTAGFCFGVNNAIETVNSLLSSGEKVCTLGSIIHNPQVVENFQSRGVLVVNDPAEVLQGYTLVIRSHGIALEVLEKIKEMDIKYVDATCPFVKKIHKIADVQTKNREMVLIGGDESHPEVIGIRSYCKGASYTFNKLEDLEKILNDHPELKENKVVILSQTTFSLPEWLKCIKFIDSVLQDVEIFDTICITTSLRQQEAEKLSKICDLMIVIGGKQSSNTAKLYDICKKNTNTIFVESAKETTAEMLKNHDVIGITAGASTPKHVVEEVRKLILLLKK